MKKLKLKSKPYQHLINKIFYRTLLIIFLAFITVMFIRSAGQGKIADTIAYLYCLVLKVDWDTAVILYSRTVRKNYDIILVGTMILFFLFYFRMLLSWFTKYFDEIIEGVDKLAEDKNEPIQMPAEMGFMAARLNQVQNALTQSREAEREAEQRKNDLIVYLAHDIKTPLTSVIGYLSLLDEAPSMPEEQRKKYVHITLNKAFRLEKLINEFFEITRYNLHSVPLNREKTDLKYMMVQIVDEAYPLLTENGKSVTIDIPEGIILYADSEKMARVFNNILRNAVTYGNADSSIHISVRQKDDFLTIRFENEGTIPQDKLPFLFEKFYRMDESRQTSTGGSGLGLAIAKDIITLHQGTITAECLNGHTIFTIQLPRGQ